MQHARMPWPAGRTWHCLGLGDQDPAEAGPQGRDAEWRVAQHDIGHRVLVDLALAARQHRNV